MITVTGHGEMSESQFSDLLKESAGCAQIEENKYRNVEDILRHPIYRDFRQLLQSREDLAKNKEDIDYRVIEVLSRLKAAGTII